MFWNSENKNDFSITSQIIITVLENFCCEEVLKMLICHNCEMRGLWNFCSPWGMGAGGVTLVTALTRIHLTHV
jgi:hypothetical protein